MYILDNIKKRAVLNSPFNSTRSETLSAYFHTSGFAAADVNLDILKVNIPTPSAMAVRVTYVITGSRSSTAGITDFRHNRLCLLASENESSALGF